MTSATLMPTIPTTTGTEISFSKQFNGYDKTEVDLYIKNLSDAYQTAYEEYTAVCVKYNDLLEDYETLGREREQTKSNTAVIAKTLIDTEILAQKIIANAHEEADKIKAETQAEAEKIREAVQIENTVAKEQARKLIENAQTAAGQIRYRTKNSLDQANESIAQAINKMQQIMASNPLDICAGEKQEIQPTGSFDGADTV